MRFLVWVSVFVYLEEERGHLVKNAAITFKTYKLFLPPLVRLGDELYPTLGRRQGQSGRLRPTPREALSPVTVGIDFS